MRPLKQHTRSTASVVGSDLTQHTLITGTQLETSSLQALIGKAMRLRQRVSPHLQQAALLVPNKHALGGTPKRPKP
jgi:hypothetical protein